MPQPQQSDDFILEYERPYLYPKQKAAIFDPRRISCIEASTKSGKTAGCIVWLAEQALAGKENHNYWWVAPVSTQADIAFRRMQHAFPREMITVHLQLKTITLVNGAVIWFKSADKADSLYGEDVYAAVIDEASRMKEDSYHAVYSTLTATAGHLRIIGNVKGRKNWFFSLARKAERGDEGMGFHRITADDAVGAGVLKADIIELARHDLPEAVFRELYMAEASDDGSNPFGTKHIAACVDDEMSTDAPRWWGWDLAKQQDYTVGIALDSKGRVCRFERFQHIPWDHILNRIVFATKSTPAFVDSTGVGDPILDFLQKKGSNYEGYKFSTQSKQKLMEGLAVAIQRQDVRFPPGRIVQELDMFQYEITRTGVRYSAPDRENDDAVMALALAVMCRAEAGAPLIITDAMVNQVAAAGMRRRHA